MSEKDQANLLAIIDSAQKILDFTEDVSDADEFYADLKTFDAVLMNFVVIGESVAKLSQEIRDEHSHILWAKIRGFRNVVAHNYFGVDAEEVWQIVQIHIASLAEDIKAIIEK